MSQLSLKGVWGDRVPRPALLVLAGATALVMVVPLLYILIRAATGEPEVWVRLFNTRLPGLLINTIGLTAATCLLTVIIGVPLAWLNIRTDLPGRRFWTWLSAVPLVFPPYIGAFTYITVLGPRGLFEKWLSRILGVPGPELGLPSVYGFFGTTWVLAMFTFPYVYTLTAVALRSFNLNLEEAGRASGLTQVEVFWRVTLPMIRPAIGAGALLVGQYALADFGTVAMLRYQTFTSAIYQQLVGRFDRSAASALSAVLVVLAFTFLWAEERTRSRGKYYQTTGSWREPRLIELGVWKFPALAFVFFVLSCSVFMPAGLLGYWTVEGIKEGIDPELFRNYGLTSLWTSAAAATAAGLFALPVAYLFSRYSGLGSRVFYLLSHSGYILPGVVVALSLIALFNNYVPWLYGTAAVMVLAYVLRFLPQGLGAQSSALAQVTLNFEEAARSLGQSPLGAARRVTLPLITNGLVAGWVLVFLSSIKELPATLLLRPVGYDTLAIRVWIEASEGFYTRAAPAALLLIMASALPLWVLLSRQLGRSRYQV